MALSPIHIWELLKTKAIINLWRNSLVKMRLFDSSISLNLALILQWINIKYGQHNKKIIIEWKWIPFFLLFKNFSDLFFLLKIFTILIYILLNWYLVFWIDRRHHQTLLFKSLEPIHLPLNWCFEEKMRW